MRTSILLASLLFAVPLTACGDDTGGGTGGGGTGGGGTGGSTTGATTTATSTGSGSGAVESVDCAGATVDTEVTTEGLAFAPTAVTVPAGGILRFTPENSTHDMTADDDTFGSATGATECFRFNDAGSYPFHCSVHASMTGTVTVE